MAAVVRKIPEVPTVDAPGAERRKIAEDVTRLEQLNAKVAALDPDAADFASTVQEREVVRARIAARRERLLDLGADADVDTLALEGRDEYAARLEARNARAALAAKIAYLDRFKLTEAQIAAKRAELSSILKKLAADGEALAAKAEKWHSEIEQAQAAMRKDSGRALELETELHWAACTISGPNPSPPTDYSHGSPWLLTRELTPLAAADAVIRSRRK